MPIGLGFALNDGRLRKIEYGDFQTPSGLAQAVCRRLAQIGIAPDSVVEPTCGVGALFLAALEQFEGAGHFLGVEVNPEYLQELRKKMSGIRESRSLDLVQADFFECDWNTLIPKLPGRVLVLGNFPWVTNSALGAMGGTNLPTKSNFHGRSGFDAISGKSNFDISEWMLLAAMKWFVGRAGDVAMLVKTAVARKVLAQAEGIGIRLSEAMIFGIDARKQFGAAVDACLVVMRMDPGSDAGSTDYTVYSSLDDRNGRVVGHRNGLAVSNLADFHKYQQWFGGSPQKWRSGVKHDAAAIMELTRVRQDVYENGLGESIELEPTYLHPLLKGSDIGSKRDWRQKFVIVTQKFVRQSTQAIAESAPRTWAYLSRHGAALDARASVIYDKNPRFSIFGVGDYAFRPWRIAICGLYKKLDFRLVEPIEGQPVMFDDTVCYISFENETEARDVFGRLQTDTTRNALSCLIFWDEKRPIKSGILNTFDWDA